MFVNKTIKWTVVIVTVSGLSGLSSAAGTITGDFLSEKTKRKP